MDLTDTELLLREMAHGALTIFDISILTILFLYVSDSRHRTIGGRGYLIALALIVFVGSQTIRSGSFWIEYAMERAGRDLPSPTPGTVALSIAPFMVLVGTSMIIYSLSDDRYRLWIIGFTAVLAVVVPTTVHFLLD